MAIINLITCNTEIEATHVKNLLENAGVESYLTNVNATNLGYPYQATIGIEVMIDEKDSQQALEVIKSMGYFEENKCPVCHSKNIGVRLRDGKFGKIVAVLMMLLAFIPFGNMKTTFYCKDCKAKFKL